MPSPIDFHVHSTFSILDGMGSPLEVVKRAKELGWPAAAISEHGWMGSAPLFYKAAREQGINPIIGCEFYIVSNEILGVKGKDTQRQSYHLTVLALSQEGYKNLVAWTTFAQRRENFHYKPRISLEAMAEIAPHPLSHNVALSGCLAGELAEILLEEADFTVASRYLDAMKYMWPNFYIEVQNHAKKKFIGHGFTSYEDMVSREEVVRLRSLELASLTNTPVILTNDSHFQTPKQREAHLAMVASKLNRGRVHIEDHLPEYGYFSNYMQDMEKIAEHTPGLEQQALDNAIEIAKEADIRLDPLDNFSYSIPFSGWKDPIKRMRELSEKRLKGLIKKHGKAARERFEYEIKAMGDFAHYLLLMARFLRYAKKQGILTNTRGSAANSLLCYCLGIHDIDPIEYGLLFSRFFNPARHDLPDIDIDIEKARYEDFMQYVKEVMDDLEGEGQVVQICNLGTFANRSSFHLIADVLGISKEEQSEIAKLLPQMIDSGMVEEENDVYDALAEEYPEIYELASGVFDSVKNISQHACGWLFGTRERPIEEWVPMCLIASSGSQVTQFNLKSLKSMGLVKGDFLRLRTLSVISKTRKLIGENALDISDIPLDDKETFEMFREGRTEGIFTLQGKENRRGVMEIEASNVHDVIASVAIYRPALTREGKDKLYNRRRKGYEPVSYSSPLAEEVLGPSYGVPIFQEQAMELAYKVGMSDAEVDEIYQAIKLAKGVGRGAKEAFAEIKPKFMKRARKLMSKEEANEYWEEIKGFQGYGFNKGHATSYGLLAYKSGFLKCHHPAEFFTALLDEYPEKSRYIAAARSEGFQIAPPDINLSESGFSLDRGNGAIRVGLARIKGFGPVAVRAILEGQPFKDYEDFKSRVPRRSCNATRIESLAALGALESLGIRKDGTQLDEFRLLGFTLKKPAALRNIKPKYTAARVSDRGWVHQGLEKGVGLTEGRTSVSKLFWIPPLGESEILELKASAYAQVKSYLLTAVDQNGVAFQIIVAEEKKGEAKILKYLAAHAQGAVVCLNGAVRSPFLNDGPMGFRFYGVVGADFNSDPQIWNVKNAVKRDLITLHQLKRRLKYEAAA